MAWTAPRTWVTAEVVTAAQMNAHIRDNFLETSTATVTTAGDLVYADAANSMGSRLAIGGAGAALVSTGTAPVWRAFTNMTGDASYVGGTTTSFADLDSPLTPGWGGTSVAVTLTTGTQAAVHYGVAYASNATGGSITILNYRVSGATTDAAANDRDQQHESSAANDRGNLGGMRRHGSLTAGSNTFTLQARVSAGTGTISYPWLAVWGL